MKRYVLFTLLVPLLLTVKNNSAQSQKQAIIDSLMVSLSREQRDSGMVNTLISLSLAYIQLNSDEALKYGRQALELARSMGWTKGMLVANYTIGRIYLNPRREIDQAFLFYNESMKLAEASKDSLYIGKIYEQYGWIFQFQGNLKKAIQYYLLATNSFKNPAFKKSLSECYIRMAETYNSEDSVIKAMHYAQMGFDLATEIHDPYTIALSLEIIAMINSHKGDYQAAITGGTKALRIFQALGLQDAVSYNYVMLADYFSEAGDDKMAVIMADSGLYVANKFNLRKEKFDYYFSLISVYKKLKNYQKAFEYMELYDNLKDSILSEESTDKIARIELSYQQQKKDAVAAEQLKTQKLLMSVFLIGFIIVVGFSIIFIVQKRNLSREKKLSDSLILNILPYETAEELKEHGAVKAKDFDEVTVMFTDFKNFTVISEQLNAQELVNEINFCYSAFDEIISRHGIEKIKTIGDSYMCAGGLPVANKTNAEDTIRAALEIRDFMLVEKQKREAKGQPFFEIKIGCHTGTVVAGIVGIKKFAYDIWGDTVNIASRMVSSGETGKVNISSSTYELVKNTFSFTYRGKIEAKNKGMIDMYFVENETGKTV